MKRKVVQHGPSSLTISLPTDWVKRYNINKGDEITINEYGKELRVYPEEIKNIIQKKEIDIGSNEKVGKSGITGAYRQGYDHIEISFSNPEFIKSIQNVMFQQVIGFEIVKQGESKCEIKDLTGHVKDEFDSAHRRIWLLLLDAAEESLKAIEKKDNEWLERMKVKDYTINRFTNYCLRHLIKQGHVDPKKTPLYYYVLKNLEEIGDGYKNACLSVRKRQNKLDKSEVDTIKRINSSLDKSYNLWYKYDKNEAENILKELKEIEEKINEKETNLPHFQSVISKIQNIISVAIQLNL
ncbi:MAG: AbrB/MazE/SpoVT family DNA-binding domain-containing protein [Candidatus Pacearchaeota archaeon]